MTSDLIAFLSECHGIAVEQFEAFLYAHHNEEAVRHGETGFLVPADDPEMLARAISSVLADPAAARAMGERGRELAETQFGIQRMVRRYEAVYAEVLLRNLV